MQEHVSLANINHLMGDELKDSSKASQTFRSFISQQKWQHENFEAWIQETVSDKLHKQLQDLVIAIGQHIGFQVEFGHYSHGYDGLWRKESGENIVIEVKTGTWIAHDVNQLGGYLQKVKEQGNISDEKIFGLYVVGNGDTQPLADQIRGSKLRDRVRLISCEDLLNLLKLKMNLSSLELKDVDQKIQSILLPLDTIDVGHLINVIMEVAALSSSLSAEDTEEEFPVTTGRSAWTRDELHRFLGGSTKNQLALFKVLVRLENKIRRKKLIEELQAETGDTELGGMQIAGARAGITMRTDKLNKEALILQTERGKMYELNPDYTGDVKSYFGI